MRRACPHDGARGRGEESRAGGAPQEARASRGQRRPFRNRLRRHVRRRDRAGRGGPLQPDHRVRGHQLPVRARGEPAVGVRGDERALRLLRLGDLRAAHHNQHAHTRARDRPQALLREERPARRRVRRGVQPHPQRQDARGGLQPRAPPLSHLPRGGRRPRRRRAQARPSPRRLHADARPHPLRGAHARRGRAPRARPVAAAAESGVRLLVGQTVPAKRASHQGPHRALGARLQAGRARRLLPGGRHLVPRAGLPRLRQRSRGRLHRQRRRPADAAQRHAPHPSHGQGRRGGLREEAHRLDGQGSSTSR